MLLYSVLKYGEFMSNPSIANVNTKNRKEYIKYLQHGSIVKF